MTGLVAAPQPRGTAEAQATDDPAMAVLDRTSEFRETMEPLQGGVEPVGGAESLPCRDGRGRVIGHTEPTLRIEEPPSEPFCAMPGRHLHAASACRLSGI